MTWQHQELAAGRWRQFSLVEQMAHVGSEVERALTWRAKHHPEYSVKACERALELLDLTLDDPKHREHRGRFKEIARTREVFVDYFWGNNQYGSSDALWRAYFSPFASAASRHR